MRLILGLAVLFSFTVNARTLIELPEPHHESISLTELRESIDTSKLKSERETDIGWLALNVTQGIKSREVKSALVSLFSYQSEITNFSVSAVGISDSEGSNQIIAIPLNSNIVTHVKIKFYCSENYIYNLEVALNAL